MHVVSVNVGTEQPIRHGKPSGKTGIYKSPRAEPVLVTPLGLEGDAIVDTANHGGLDQLIPYQGPAVSVLELFRCFYKKQLTEDELRRFLAVPIPNKERPHYEEMLARVLAAAAQ